MVANKHISLSENILGSFCGWGSVPNPFGMLTPDLLAGLDGQLLADMGRQNKKIEGGNKREAKEGRRGGMASKGGLRLSFLKLAGYVPGWW